MSEHAPYGPPNPHAPYEVGAAGTVSRAQLTTALAEGILRNVKEFGCTGAAQVGEAKAEGVKLQEALTAAKASGLFFPAALGYMTDKVLKVFATTTLAGASEWDAIIRTTATTEYILQLEEGQINIGAMRFEAATKQTAGGAIDFSKTTSFARVENCTFGDRFFIGLNIAGGIGTGAIALDTLKWIEAGAGLAETGTCIKIGDGVHLVVGVWANKIYMLGATTAGIKQGILYNYCDSCTLTDSLLQTMTKAITTGTIGPKETTGLKIVDTVVDTTGAPCFDFGLVKDAVCTGCNAQGGFQGIVFRAEKEGGIPAINVRWIGGEIQVNIGWGAVFEIGTEQCRIECAHVINNNTSNTAGLGGIYLVQGTRAARVVDNYVANVFAGKQKKGIFVEAGVESVGYVITGNTCPIDAEQLAGVEDLGTGKNKRVRGNLEGVVEYRAKTARATGAAIAGSTAGDVFMVLAIEVAAATAARVELQIDGKWAGEVAVGVDASGINILQMTGVVPSGKSWELKVLAGAVAAVNSSYLPL